MNVEQLKLYLAILRRRYLLVTTCLVMGLVLAAAYCLLTPEIYEATATLLIEYNGPTLNDENPLTLRNAADIATQVQLIGSQVIVDRALSGLRDYQLDPALAGMPKDQMVDEVIGKLRLSNPRNTRLVRIGYLSKDPSAAASLVGNVADAYVQFINDSHRSSSRETLETLTQQRDELESQLLEYETDLVRLREETGVISADNVRTTVYEKRISFHEEELGKAQIDRLRADATLRQLSRQIEQGDGSLTLPLGSDALASDLMKMRFELLLQRDEDAQELERRSHVYGENHPLYKALASRLAERRKYIEDPGLVRRAGTPQEARQWLQIAEQNLADAKEVERYHQRELEEVRQQSRRLHAQRIELSMLESKAERLKLFHEVVLQRIKELDLGEDLARMKVEIVGPPTLPKDPIWPNIPKVMVTALLGGAVAGMGLALLMDRLNNNFRSPEDVQQELDLPVLGNVPRFDSELGFKPDWLVAQAPRSPEAEAFRTIRTGLFFRQDARLLAVTSALQGDGKSTVLANLALALAQAGKRVLVIDCDLRRPRQRAIWDLPLSKGMVDLLSSETVTGTQVEPEVFATQFEGVAVLPAGPTPGNPAELLERMALLDVLNWAKTHYDFVLVDCPPVLPVADASIVGRLVDGVLLVIRVDTDGRTGVLRAQANLTAVGGTILGIVVNGIDQQGAYGYHYYRKASYRNYYASAEEPEDGTRSAGAELAQSSHRSQDRAVA